MRLHVLNRSHSLNSCCLFYCRFVVGDQKAALSYTRGEFCNMNSVFLHSLPAEGSPSVLQLTSLKMLLFPLQILLILNIFLWGLEVVVRKETSPCFKCVNWHLCRGEYMCTPSPFLNKDSKYLALWDPAYVLKRETWCQALPQSNTVS